MWGGAANPAASNLGVEVEGAQGRRGRHLRRPLDDFDVGDGRGADGHALAQRPPVVGPGGNMVPVRIVPVPVVLSVRLAAGFTSGAAVGVLVDVLRVRIYHHEGRALGVL